MGVDVEVAGAEGVVEVESCGNGVLDTREFEILIIVSRASKAALTPSPSTRVVVESIDRRLVLGFVS